MGLKLSTFSADTKLIGDLFMNQILTFKVGPESFCLDVHCVTGIEQAPKITRVPLSEKHLLGMMNLRGQIIPVIDLRILFNLDNQEKTKEQCHKLHQQGMQFDLLLN